MLLQNFLCASIIVALYQIGNSFIPYDVKREYGLPTYKEKDAIYTYHFYHLIQRAKNVYITYNTEPDVIKGGEKSRLITQLEIEKMHNIRHQVVLPKTPKNNTSLLTIKKTKQLVEELKVVAQKGFSPSSLTTYIRNPIDFYYQKILTFTPNLLVFFWSKHQNMH